MIAAVNRSTVQYPGGLSARFRWAGSGQSESVFSLTEGGGRLDDYGVLVSSEPDRLCRAELRIEGPVGVWTARFASPVFDEPQGLLWDVPSLLLVKYGFQLYALSARTGDLRWTFASGTPLIAVLGSPRLPHVIAQGEIETTALLDDGTVAWRVAHSDAVVEAALVGGQLVLTSYADIRQTLDPVSGQSAN